MKSYPIFDNIVKNNQLGMYSYWPVPNYYQVLLAAGVKLLADGDTAAYLKSLETGYNQD